MSLKVAVIGGGAAGFFAALNCKENYPEYTVDILEKSNKVLAKVKVSGGGRCNVTHHCLNVNDLCAFYPRGRKKLKPIFTQFQPLDTIEWFKSKGVELKVESDNRMFPTTDQSFTIINCLMDEAARKEVSIKMSTSIDKITQNETGYTLWNGEEEMQYDKVIVAAGGGPKLDSYKWLKELQLNIVPPVPSLFTFNLPGANTAELMGVVAPQVGIKIQGTKIHQNGPLLFTHWGFSGPAVLKSSAWGARDLSNLNYNFNVSINWTGLITEDAVRELVTQVKNSNPKKKIQNAKIAEGITNRLWDYLLNKCELKKDQIWVECPKKQLNKLINTLYNDVYKVQGKTTFKEEFVTCGGIDLNELDLKTMQSKTHDGLFFAGEILDIDGVTGGFNFQAAWSTGFIAAKLGQ